MAIVQVLGIIVEILLIEVHFVKLIELTTIRQSEPLPKTGAIQQVKGGYTPVFGCE